MIHDNTDFTFTYTLQHRGRLIMSWSITSPKILSLFDVFQIRNNVGNHVACYMLGIEKVKVGLIEVTGYKLYVLS